MSNTKEQMEIAVDNSIQPNEEDEPEDDNDLFVCLDECYVYKLPGDAKGNPKDDAHILYDTVIEEILQLDVNRRNGNYVWCLLPVEGWVYLPQEDAQYDWGPLNEILERKRRLKGANPDDANEESADKGGFDEHGYMPTKLEEIKSDSEKNDFDSYHAMDDPTLITEERRNYNQQRIMMQTMRPEVEGEVNKLFQIKFLRWLIFYFRRNPFLPGLIVLIIQAVIEVIIVWDVVSDIRLAMEIFREELYFLFAVSWLFINAPYVIAWTAASSMNAKKLKQNSNNIFQIIGCMLFNIAPVGIAFLLLVDIYHLIECVAIKPIFYLLTCGKQIRTISYGELGYYKLRRVSEIFAEAVPQAFVQAYILYITEGTGTENIRPFTVISALGSSVLVLCLWCTIIFVEGKKNGMSFVEYVTVIFQGSFNFVEMLPAIERGTKTGEKVNWTAYKFSEDGVGHAAKGLNSPNCRLSLLKISKYTIKDLDRYGCRFLGGALNQRDGKVDLIVSRLEEEIMALYDKYDTDQGKSLDFEEFVHLCLDIKQKMNEPCLRSDVYLIYEELADSVPDSHEVWQLDLIIKIKGSLDFMNLIDYKLPLQHAFETGDLCMISLLMAYGYPDHSPENLLEFEYCVSSAVTSGKIREALCLCEHKGVPIVIRMEKGSNLMACDDDGASDPYVRVSIFDQQQTTQYRKQTLDPIWDEDLLFIIPFDFMEKILHSKKGVKEEKEEDEDDDGFLYASPTMRGNGAKTGGTSFAAIDLKESVVTGLSMPQYAQDAIVADMKEKYGKDFSFQDAGSAKSLGRQLSKVGNMGNMERVTTDPVSKSSPILSMEAAHERERRKSGFIGKKDTLTVRFRVFDHDIDDDDDFMGSHKERIVMTDDTAEYHAQSYSKELVYDQKAKGSVGSISYRIFLNAVQIYQDHTLKYIDSGVKDKELNDDLFVVSDSKPQSIGDASNYM